jgi:hypothetical protein
MKLGKEFTKALEYAHKHVQNLNNSKIFAGLMIIILNIASKFVNFKFSKSIEMYLKHTFSKQVLVFAIAWMGTRDIYIAILITIIFIIFMDYIFNEDSMFCCLPESFTNYHLELDKVSDDDIKKAKEVLAKAEEQNML